MAPVLFAPRVVRANRRKPGDRDQPLTDHGWFMSFKTGDAIPYKGLLAFHFLSIMEADHRIESIRKGRRPITWYDGKEWQSYVPRYTLRVHGKTAGHWRWLEVEVVTSLEANRDRLMYNRIMAGAVQQARRFKIYTETHVNIEPRLTNAKLVVSQAGQGMVSAEETHAVQSFAHRSSTFTLNEMVAAGVLAYGQAYAAALNLVALGKLAIEASRQFDGDSKIWLRSKS